VVGVKAFKKKWEEENVREKEWERIVFQGFTYLLSPLKKNTRIRVSCHVGRAMAAEIVYATQCL